MAELDAHEPQCESSGVKGDGNKDSNGTSCLVGGGAVNLDLHFGWSSAAVSYN